MMEREQTTRAMVVGYGNLLRGDDGLGIAVVEEIRRELGRNRNLKLGFTEVTTRTMPYLNLAVAEEMAGYSTVILIDALLDDTKEDVRVIELPDLADTTTVSSHSSSPVMLANLITSVYGASPRFYVVGVKGEIYELGKGFSRRTKKAIGSAVATVLEILTVKSY